jgi:hypothetical protein
MRLTIRSAIVLTVVSVLLCVVQAGIWAKDTSHVTSQTAEQNKEIRHPPSEIPGVAGLTLLLVTAVLLSLPDAAKFESGDGDTDEDS